LLLHLQSDGDLVLSSSGGTKWRSYTAGVGARVDMLWNGNLVVVDHVDSIVFQTSTSAHAAAYLILHNSGELAIYWRARVVVERLLADTRDMRLSSANES